MNPSIRITQGTRHSPADEKIYFIVLPSTHGGNQTELEKDSRW
jgi:hypothetical protein